MKIYVMRHGQTDWNAERRVQGRTDIELNETGIEQAENAREEFSKYDINLIISSPLKRAIKTAEIVSKENVPIIIDERIVERCFGDKEGICPHNEPNLPKKNFWDYTANLGDWNVEPVQELCKRVWGLLDEVKEQHNDKNVLLVTHGGTTKAINAYFEGIAADGVIPNVGIENCEIKEYEYVKENI